MIQIQKNITKTYITESKDLLPILGESDFFVQIKE